MLQSLQLETGTDELSSSGLAIAVSFSALCVPLPSDKVTKSPISCWRENGALPSSSSCLFSLSSSSLCWLLESNFGRKGTKGGRGTEAGREGGEIKGGKLAGSPTKKRRQEDGRTAKMLTKSESDRAGKRHRLRQVWRRICQGSKKHLALWSFDPWS